MLQTRIAKRTAAAAVKIAVQMVDEGIISEREAVERVEPAQVDQLLRAQFDPAARKGAPQVAKGLNASPGAAVGRAVFSADTAVEWVEHGEKVVLVRVETSPDDFHGMAVAQGILTARGGATSHAAVVARQIGKPCVAGCARAPRRLRTGSARSTISGTGFAEGDWISVDGSTGEVFLGALPTVEARFEDQPDLQRILGWADGIRRMGVWTNADKPEEAAQARSLRRGGHRPLPHRAHVPRGRAPRDRARRHPRRQRCHARQGQGRRGRGAQRRRGRGRGHVRRRHGQARGAPAGRLRGHLRGHGRPARGRPPHRPAAPRVPAQPRGAARQGHPGRRRRQRGGPRAAGHDQVDARAEPHARPARLPPGHHDPRLRQDPDAGHPQRPGRGHDAPGATPSPRS